MPLRLYPEANSKASGQGRRSFWSIVTGPMVRPSVFNDEALQLTIFGLNLDPAMS